jgi:hypothetical protein
MRMLKPLIAAVLVTFPLCAFADVVVLKDGSRIEGEVVEDGERIRIKLDCGDMAVPRSQVDHVTKRDTPQQKFKKKLAETAAGDVEALGKLREWCTENRLEKEAAQIALKISQLVLEKKAASLEMKKVEDVFDMALWCKRSGYDSSVVDSYLWKVVSLEPDHAAAREMLGYRKFRGQWLRQEEIERIEQAEYDKEMRLKGMVLHDGQWLKPDAAAYKREVEKLEREREDLERERDRLEDDAREQAKEGARLESLRRELYTESCRLRQWEDNLERTAAAQESLARQLAWERCGMDRLQADMRRLEDKLEKEKKDLEQDKRDIDREKDGLQQLRQRMEWELREQRRKDRENEDRRSGTERPKNPQEKFEGSKEQTTERRPFSNSREDDTSQRRDRR